MAHLCRVFLLCVAVAAVQADPEAALNPTPAPVQSSPAKPTEATEQGLLEPVKGLDAKAVIELTYLEAPLSKASMGNKLAAFNLFHGGLGFKLKGSGSGTKEWAVEYNAVRGLGGALMPMADGSNNLVFTGGIMQWLNDGEVMHIPQIDKVYWTKYTKIADLSLSQYSGLAKYIGGYLKQHPSYKLWQIFSPKNSKPEPSLDSSTCVDFVWRAFQFLDKLGVCLKTSAKPERVYVSAFDDTKRRELDMEKKYNRDIVQRWYKRVVSAYQEAAAGVPAPPSGQQQLPQMLAGLVSQAGMFEKVVSKLAKQGGRLRAAGTTWYFYSGPGKVLQVKLNPKLPMSYKYDNRDKELFGSKNCK